VEKLGAAGITTVEALADMTPEQLEAIEGIGPKTVEKISLAVNNYFAGLETAEAPAAEGAEAEVEGAASGEVLVAPEGTAEAEAVESEVAEGSMAEVAGQDSAEREVAGDDEPEAAKDLAAAADSVDAEPTDGHHEHGHVHDESDASAQATEAATETKE
jgi:N utilization substance protein A